jgi:hypothetical protein
MDTTIRIEETRSSAWVAAGGAMTVAAALTSWATVRSPGGVIDGAVRGASVGWGRLAMACAAIAVVAGLATGLSRLRRAAGALALAASVAAAGLVAAVALTASERLGGARMDEVARGLATTIGLPFRGLRRHLAEQVAGGVTASPEPGLYLALAGAVVAAVAAGRVLLHARSSAAPERRIP